MAFPRGDRALKEFFRRLSPQALVWALASIVLAVVAAYAATGLRHAHALMTPHLPWWALVLGFAVAERAVVHLHFRHSAHSFTLADLPMVLGLIFSAGTGLLIGALVGSSITWILDRRLPPIKIVFNLAQLGLATCVAIAIVHTVSWSGHTISPPQWLIVLAAVVAGALVSVALVAAAITLTEGQIPRGVLRQMFGLDLALTVTTTALALLTAILIRNQPQAVPLMILPAGFVYLAYRAYLHQRQQHDRLEFLYEETRALAESPDVLGGLERLLERCLEVFRLELVELVLFSAHERLPLRLARPAPDQGPRMVPIDPEAADDLLTLVAAGDRAVIVETEAVGARGTEYLRARGVKHAIAAALAGDDRAAGMIMLANRVGVERAFDQDDLDLLEALAHNTSVALQFDRLEQAIWQLRDLHEQLEHQSLHDSLTGLANRSLFVRDLKEALARDTGAIAVLLADLDDFRGVNERLGHATGDEVLVAVGERLQDCVHPGDLVARVGGDEFGILLRDLKEPAEAGVSVARRITQVLSEPVSVSDRRVSVAPSIGVAGGRAGYDSADELVRNADIAMYEAKQAGKGQHALFEPRMRSAAVERHRLRGDLEHAIAEDELTVEYQPIVSIADQHVVAAEAFVRWQRGYGRTLSAAEFLPAARESGLMSELGERVISQACRQARDWLGVGPGGGDLAVHLNLSQAELDDPTLARRVAAVLEQSGLPPELVVFEVAEATILREPDRSRSRLRDLVAVGLRVGIDQFGAATSSLAYLRELPVSYVKVPCPRAEAVSGRQRDVAFLRTLCALGESLDVQLIATEVETMEDLDQLRTLDWKFAQGHLIGRPAAGALLLETGLPPHKPTGWLGALPDWPTGSRL